MAAVGTQQFGADHPQTAAFLNRLGGVVQAQGDLPAAEKIYRQALEIDRAALGETHQSLARDWNNLGVVLEKMKDRPGAEEAYRKALEIMKVLLPADHPYLKGARKNLARLEKGENNAPKPQRRILS
jgi:tetratricopeptide (TPR) repeat protein